MNYAASYNRPQGLITPPEMVYSLGPLNYPSAGYLPNIAQAAQNKSPTDFVGPKSYFTTSQFNFAEWFTNRVHLVAVGKE